MCKKQYPNDPDLERKIPTLGSSEPLMQFIPKDDGKMK